MFSPVPGGPSSSTPAGILAPNSTKRRGSFKIRPLRLILVSLLQHPLHQRNERDWLFVGLFRFGFSKVHDTAATAATAALLAHHHIEEENDDYDWQETNQQTITKTPLFDSSSIVVLTP